MNTIKSKINSLYIHIPFCKSICPYCDFTKFCANDEMMDKYIDELIKDIKDLQDKNYSFKTIYIGGGTPSVLSLFNTQKLLFELNKLLDFTTDYEFTIEANPESITEDKLKIYKRYGINRISIGIQSFNKNILKSLNRDFSINYDNLIELVKKYIQNINVDLIYGLPNQTLDNIKNDLDCFISLDIEHISTYSLSVNPGTIYYNNKIQEVSDEKSREFYDLIYKVLSRNGFNRYEVSNYSKPGKESKHNLAYRKNEEYIALGCGASGYFDKYRYKISSSLSKFIAGERKYEVEIIDDKSKEEYFYICNLRLKEGFSLEEYKNVFKKDFLIVKEKEVKKLIKQGLIYIKDNRVMPTYEGILLLDFILREII